VDFFVAVDHAEVEALRISSAAKIPQWRDDRGHYIKKIGNVRSFFILAGAREDS